MLSGSVFFSAFPKFFWILPSSCSARPLMCWLVLSVASPHVTAQLALHLFDRALNFVLDTPLSLDPSYSLHQEKTSQLFLFPFWSVIRQAMCPKSRPKAARFGIDLAKPGPLAEIPKLNAICPAAGGKQPL